jgi:hypothetical protein
MLRWLLRRSIRKFQRDFDYDASYSTSLITHAPWAMVWLFLAPRIVRRPQEIPLAAWFAAGLTGVIEADCGPCTQLGVRFAQRAGVPDPVLRAVLAGDEAAMTPDVRLAVRYARAALRHDLDADDCRAQILGRWGPRALARMAYAVTVSGLFPTIKYALGHGQTCATVRVGDQTIPVHRPMPQEAA